MATTKEYHLTVNGHAYVVTLKSLSGERAEVEVDGENYEVDIQSIHQKGSPKRRTLRSSSQVAPAGGAPAAPAPAGPAPAAPSTPSGDAVAAPIPGAILEIYVKEGDSVEAGKDLLKMEAMKMENRISAPKAGKVSKIHVGVGDAVSQGQALIEIS